MKIGYARVSTLEQNLNMQVTALEQAGCEKIFQEKRSGRKVNRPELNNLLEFVRPGDMVVVWKLDRLGRSMKQLVNLVSDWRENEIHFMSITDSLTFDGTPMNNALFHVMAAMCQMESDLGKERTMAGLREARRRGRVGGRPPGLSEDAKKTAAAAKTLYMDHKMKVRDIGKRLQIAQSTLYKYLRYEGVEIGASINSSKRKVSRNHSSKRNLKKIEGGRKMRA